MNFLILLILIGYKYKANKNNLIVGQGFSLAKVSNSKGLLYSVSTKRQILDLKLELMRNIA